MAFQMDCFLALVPVYLALGLSKVLVSLSSGLRQVLFLYGYEHDTNSHFQHHNFAWMLPVVIMVAEVHPLIWKCTAPVDVEQ